jgi:acyl carrier protein
MRPAAIMVLDSLPRTSNGKVDRRALPAPLPEQQLHARALVSPRTSEEEKLAAIWSKILGVSEVSVEDSIFELGGDSLLIFRITTHAQQAGLNINARQIFQFRTISAICAQLGQPDENGTAQTKKASIQAVSRKQYRRTLTTLETAGN